MVQTSFGFRRRGVTEAWWWNRTAVFSFSLLLVVIRFSFFFNLKIFHVENVKCPFSCGVHQSRKIPLMTLYTITSSTTEYQRVPQELDIHKQTIIHPILSQQIHLAVRPHSARCGIHPFLQDAMISALIVRISSWSRCWLLSATGKAHSCRAIWKSCDRGICSKVFWYCKFLFFLRQRHFLFLSILMIATSYPIDLSQ